jgi:Flp pilus assembly pilin Flp
MHKKFDLTSRDCAVIMGHTKSTDRGGAMFEQVQMLWSEDQGQDIAEYAVMLAVILVLVVGTVRLIGSNANNAFSTVASAIQ